MALADVLGSQTAEIVWGLDSEWHVATADDISFSGSTLTSAALANLADLPPRSFIRIVGSGSNDQTIGVVSSTSGSITCDGSFVTESAGATVTILWIGRVATKTWIAEPGDSVDPHRIYLGGMSAPRLTRTWFDEANLSGASKWDFGDLEVMNHTGWWSHLAQHGRTADGQKQTLWVGTPGDDLADHGTYELVAEAAYPTSDGLRIRIELRGNDRKAYKRLQEDRYLGLGTAVEFNGSTSRSVSRVHAAALSHTAWLGVRVIFKLASLPATAMVLAAKAALGAGDEWSVWIDGSNRVRCMLREDTTTTLFGVTGQTLDSSHLDSWHSMWMIWDGTDIRLYFDGALDPAGATAFSGTPQEASRAIYVGQNSGASQKLNGIVADVAVFANSASAAAAAAWTAAEVKKWARRPFELQSLPADLQLYWRFQENGGTTVADETANALDGTLSASTFWVSTYEGEQHQVDQPKPICVGSKHTLPTLIDQKNRIYQVHHGRVRGIGFVTDGGARLSSGLTFSSNDLSFSGSVMTLNTPDANLIDLYGISSGQQVTLTPAGAGANGGTFTLAADAKGSTITITGSFTTEAAGVDTYTVQFKASGGGAADFVPDLDLGTLTLASTPTYALIAFVRGATEVSPPTGRANQPRKAGDVLWYLLNTYGGFSDSEIDTAAFLALDSDFISEFGVHPNVGIAVGAEDRTLNGELDFVAQSVLASWGTKIDGTFEVVRRTAPDGATPDVSLTDREILDIERVRSIPAITSKVVRWGRNPTGGLSDDQIADVLDGVIEGEFEEFLRNPWREVAAPTSDQVDAQHPLPNPGEILETALSSEAAALAVAAAAYAMDSSDREIFRVSTASLVAHDEEIRSAVIGATDDDFATLETEKPTRALRIETDGETGHLTMWLWG